MNPSHRTAALAVTAAGLAVAGSLQGTQAAFTATTSSAGTFTAGTVVLSDDDSGSALFSATTLSPGDTDSKCIKVTYTGNLANEVRLHVAVTETDAGGVAANALLDSNLNVTIEYDTTTTGAFAGCGDFASEGTLYNGTLFDLDASHYDWTSGAKLGAAGTAWTPATNVARVFKITYTLASAAPDSVQGDSAVGTFTWEAQST